MVCGYSAIKLKNVLTGINNFQVQSHSTDIRNIAIYLPVQLHIL